ncbi:gentisate 1,2-dioxygenase [Pseudomonas sp. ICMP 8385]|uniref:fumarylacetoacetate hydrolase family protein n=1 Tax=Pseudomonas sp. ICMP 8385 TaxID=1718920 RepID=UPI000C078C3D|nr:fumarylacetoacetate hydrolase family protein [Pseudomonas sp. ICMP 8385]PHN58416.1 gentisate 1,2-dioxygenase [Pseudomonas sp. ICMP 8385]
MRLVTYQNRARTDAARLGVWLGERVVDVARLAASAGQTLPDSMLGLIDAGPDALALLGRLCDPYADQWPPGTSTWRDNVHLLAPIPQPRKNIFGIGLNYREHVAESSRSLDTAAQLPSQPVVFSKPPTSVIGPGDGIEHNAQLTQQLDWEVELAVVIGRQAKGIAESQAMDYVFGYTVINDISARDNRRAGQWIFSKGQDTYCPMGPCLVTADEIKDPHNLALTLKKNGELKQESNTRHMLFRIPALIADIASAITLEPGDIIATGTPSGVGAGRTPQEWMVPGDVIEAWVEGIGLLRNPVVNSQ